MSRILITGASSVVGRYLLPILEAQRRPVIALSRRSDNSRGSVMWLCSDIGRGNLPPEVGTAEVLIHLAPLPLLIPLLCDGNLTRLHRVVAIGTTSVFTKSDSRVLYERTAMANQWQAEQALVEAGKRLGFCWTLFRPTLVYDGIHDKNIVNIAHFISRFRFFPIVKPGSGLRQPLHAVDLAWACAAVLDKPATEFQSYNLAGNQVLSYREMVEQVFRSLGKQPRIIPIWPWLYRRLLFIMGIHPRYRYINSEIAGRMNLDMVFDISAARRDFGFSPRSFHINYPDDYAMGIEGQR